MKERWELLNEILRGAKFYDLSPTLESGIPKWPSHPSVVIDRTFTHEHDGFFCQSLFLGEHSGAHVDMPAHTTAAMRHRTVDTYPVEALFAPAIKYDLRGFDPQPGERVSRAQLLQLEAKMGDGAREGDIALLDFGWQRYWSTGRDWTFYAKNEPGLEEEAVLLFKERGVRAVGCDTVACDMPLRGGEEFTAYGHHVHWLPNGILILEMLHNLSQLPTRCYFCALPLKIRGGSGSPIRPMAIV